MKKKLSIIAIILSFFSLFLLGCETQNESIEQTAGEMTVHYIDVGQGDSILIQVNNKNLLIDAGPGKSKDMLLNYLDSLNLKKIDYVIATHPHEDHIGNLDDVKKKDLKINVIKEGTNSIDLGEGTKVSVFSPIKAEYKKGSQQDFNNYSPVMKIEFGKTSFLFTGDAEAEVEKEILKKGYDVSADVLKFGHHGSSTSTSEAFLKAVNPSIGVIQLAEDNTYGHPHKETLDLIKKYKLNVYRNDIDGDIVLSSDGTNIIKKK